MLSGPHNPHSQSRTGGVPQETTAGQATAYSHWEMPYQVYRVIQTENEKPRGKNTKGPDE
ncbi:hypothetical protein E2C01_088205 [Portunus trituberculatus]|uniref:Uncharacterized protein n=1 Tax=Portunus trituberculatus TaxID=210409 RepID=A0A5B7JJ91_PORTR|nr:hypothetical protein [Portunus trituberculatus]